MSQAMQKISKARAGLIIDQPFFASLLLPMPISASDAVPTMGTDGDSIIYNEKWVSSLNPGEVTFVLAHETLHCVFDHMGRRESRTPNRWNQAADYIINDILVKEKIGTMPKQGLLDAALVAQGGGTAEGVYRLLPDSAEKNGAGDKGGALDAVTDAGSEQGTKPVDSATAAQKSADMKVRVIQAKNAAKMAGKLSAGIDALVKELVKPVVDWREVLRRFLSERAKIDYTFAKPKRRFLGEDMILPGLSGERMGEIVYAIDCSGSIYGNMKLLSHFNAEINAIREDISPAKITVVYFDSKVTRDESFEADEEITLKPKGGGGTAFSPVFEFIEAMATPPAACVFFTDLECSDYGPPPAYPVLWCVFDSRGNETAPFGEIVPVKEME